MQVPGSPPQNAGLQEEPSDSAAEECCMSLLWGELTPELQLECGDPRFAPLEPLSEQSEQSERRGDDFLLFDSGLGSYAASDEEPGRCQLVAPASPPEVTEGPSSAIDIVRFFTHRVWPSFHACPLLWNVGPAADPVHVLQATPPEAKPTKQRELPSSLIQAWYVTDQTAAQRSQGPPSPLPLMEEGMKAEVKGSTVSRKASLVSRACAVLLRALACGCVGRPQVAA
jgi:hypothetical protein